MLINVLIRTSNRKALFTRAIRSVQRQSYKNLRIIVSYDTEIKPSYIPNSIQSICVSKTKQQFKQEKAFYNRYCNNLKEVCDANSMIFFLDDDDYIKDKNALQVIVAHLQEGKINIVQLSRNGNLKPLNEAEGVVCGRIGMPCFLLHAKHKDLAEFDGTMQADFTFIKTVAEKIGSNFIPVVLVEAGKRLFGAV